MSISRETCQQQLDIWIAADAAVAKGQSYRIGERQLTRADAAVITQKIEYWSGKLQAAKQGGRSMTIGYGIPE